MLQSNLRFEWSFPAIAGAQDDQRPVFVFRVPALKQWREFQKIRKQASDLSAQDSSTPIETAIEMDGLLARAIGVLLVGWRKVATVDRDIAAEFGLDASTEGPWELPYRPDLLPAVMTAPELWQILREMPTALYEWVGEQVNPPAPASEPVAAQQDQQADQAA